MVLLIFIPSFHPSGPQVNTNGILSFRFPFTEFTPHMFPCPDNVPLIAPFWDNVDIERFGNISYRETSDCALLQKAQSQLQELFPSSGDFNPTTLFIATWDQVAVFEEGSAESEGGSAEFEGGFQVPCLLL